MNSFWSSAFSQFRNCGHNAHLFFALGMVGLVGGIIAGALVVEFHDYLPGTLAICFVLLSARWLIVSRRRARRRRNKPDASAPSRLSEDELRVARSKLRSLH